MRPALERHCNRIWFDHGPPPLGYRVLERIYRLTLGGRWRRPQARPPVPVIVVGNLTVGGGGKTPVVIALAGHLADSGKRVGVISRGYGGRHGGRLVHVHSDSDPDQCGDEPVLIARSAGVPVWVCRDRRAAMTEAVAHGCEVVVADDGLQHVALPRSFELCVIDGARGLGNGRLLPAGPLRQPRERLNEVDQILIKGGGFDQPGSLDFHLRAKAVTSLDGVQREPPRTWRGRTVDAVCGIANPASFLASLESLGINARLHARPDHHRFTPADFDHLEGPIMVTTKDAVKLSGLNLDQAIHVLEVRAELPPQLLQRLDRHVQDYAD